MEETQQIQHAKNRKSKFGSFMKENWPSILALIYIISPIDFIPEAFAPIVGSADDAVVLILEIARRWYLHNKSHK
ncbi:DUF1232 domain-containing protein [Candidatus Dojkabacteria bacterium]|nr:DUF1232 domain-containing protein [Candidatus Dojkabacteria bacterium]